MLRQHLISEQFAFVYHNQLQLLNLKINFLKSNLCIGTPRLASASSGTNKIIFANQAIKNK